MDLTRPLRPTATPSLRPWAGRRLGVGVGEMWAAGPASVIVLPDGTSTTLDELAAAAGGTLVGSAGLALFGTRFPLLAKLIDADDWLSLQVHPDDDLARRMYGETAVGKDEVWVVLGTVPETRLVTGPRRALDADEVVAQVALGTMGLDACEIRTPAPGDVLNVRSGTIHAIGPGSFVYELEEPSDLTFRISDWGRPPIPGRHLHLDEARQAVDPALHAELVGSGWRLDGAALNDRRIRLELVAGPVAHREPGMRSPEIVTAFGGPITLRGPGWTELLDALETCVVPAAVAGYALEIEAPAIGIVGSLPR